jgi:hypothetical protein
MTQNPGDWGQQGQQRGYPPQQPGGYPPQQPGPGGYSPQEPGYPQQPVAYPPQQPPQQAGYPPPGGWGQQGSYAPQPPPGGYPPQQPGGYGPQGPAGGAPGAPGGPGAPAKKSPVMIIAIVAAAIVLLAAVGGIIMVLTRGGESQPDVSITPSEPAPPTEQPTPQPTGQPTPEPQPSETQSSQPPTGGTIDLSNGIELTPAAGWQVKKTGKNVAQLSDGKSLFLGQSLQISPSTNPGQLCDAWHRDVAEDTSNGKFQDPKDVDVGTTRLKAATCVAQVTVSGGQGSTKLYLFSLVSVRQSDGVTVIGTTYFTPNANTDQLNKDFTSMINSMLRSQASGG